MSEGSFTPIDEQIAAAVRDGVRSEAAPVGRHLAEVRGLSVRAIRQLERIESGLGAEREARVDDLAVLVDLISAGGGTRGKSDFITSALTADRHWLLAYVPVSVSDS